MADESDRNLWDVLGLPNKTDVLSVQEKEQYLCTNGVQEGDLDKAQSDIAQGTSLSKKVTAKPSSVSIADVLCCSESPDVHVTNGGDTIEKRHIQQESAMKILANQRRDLPGERVELTNGETSAALKYSASVNNGSVESMVEPPRNVPDVAEHIVVTAVNANNNKQAEKSAVTQERSIFEHINSNFRPAVVPLQNYVRENVASETGMHKNTSETTVSSNVICLSDTIRNVEPSSGDIMDQNNLFERVRINSFIDSLAQRTIAREVNGVFPFSEKLRHLTTINKDAGNNMSTTIHPLRTGYDTASSGRSFQRRAPVSASHSASNAIAARIVNGQLQSLGAQVITPPEVSQVDSNVIFPSVAPFKYPSAVSTSANNSYPNRQVTSVYNAMNGTAVGRNNAVIDTNTVVIQPNAVAKLKRIAAESPNGEHAQKNLAATHLIGPFISAGPPPPNTYVAAVRTAQAQTLTNGLQSSAYPQFPDVRSTLKGHSSSSGFQLVLPVGITSVGIPPPPVVNRILPPPISLTSLEENTSLKGNQRNLICGEKLVPSPDLQERMFRPVSPAKSGINSTTSPWPRGHHDGVSRGASRGFHCSPLRARRSIFSRKTDMESSRGSVEEELAEQSYQCALRESANSPDIERYLRCESPLTVLSSPNRKSSCNSLESNHMESSESYVNSSALCNGVTEKADIPSTYPEENNEDCSSPKTPPSTEISGEETDASKKKLNSAMVRRLEPRLPSPVRARCAGDLYRDPSELTREERALQRAMMQFSEMEMKEKAQEIKKKDSFKRRLRKRHKDKPNTITNDTTKQSATKVWLKKFKRKRLWFSQRRSITVKPPAVQEDDSLVKSSEDQQTQPVKRKRSNSIKDNTEQPKIRRKSVETDKRALVAKPKDVHQTKAVLPNHKNTGTKPAKVRRTSSDTRSLEKNKKENLPESTSCKRSLNTNDVAMGTKAAKRARVEIEPLKVKKQDVIPPNNADSEKGDRSHRVKTYMLVTAYQGFRDFKPIVLESRTRGKSKQTDEEPHQKPCKASEFPLLVVESVNSKPIKNSIIAENEEVQHLVENCLKARGKWQIEEIVEESVNEDENLKEARKLNVNRNTGETILHKAARLGYHETVHHHIHQGIDPNAKDNAGWTPLHEACSRGHIDVVKVLAKYGADVNACSNDGIRPIHDAAEGGHVGVLRVLLRYGADPLLATYSGNTALSCTREPNSKAFLKGFLEDLDLKTPSTSAYESEGCWDFSGSCPLLDNVPDHTSGIFEGVPTNNSLQAGEFEMCDRPHLPTYNLPVMTSDDVISGRRNYVLLSDVLEHLRISRGALLKKAKRLDIREMPWSQFIAEIVDKPLCIAPKYSPPDSSTQEGVAELVSVNYNLRRLLNIRIESVNMT